MKRAPGKHGPQYPYLKPGGFESKRIVRIQTAQGRLQNRLNECRMEQALTQVALAKMAGVARMTVSEIETGKRDPSASVTLAIAKALGRPVEEIFELY